MLFDSAVEYVFSSLTLLFSHILYTPHSLYLKCQACGFVPGGVHNKN